MQLVQIFAGEERIAGKMSPGQTELKSLVAVTGSKALEQLHSSIREVQQSTVDRCSLADGSSELGGTVSLQAVVGMRSEN